MTSSRHLDTKAAVRMFLATNRLFFVYHVPHDTLSVRASSLVEEEIGIREHRRDSVESAARQQCCIQALLALPPGDRAQKSAATPAGQKPELPRRS